MRPLFEFTAGGKFLGHPLHVMLVHFPIAFFPLSFGFDLATFHYPQLSLFPASVFMAGAGIAAGIPAILTGAGDLLSVKHLKALSLGFTHALLGITATGGFFVIFMIRFFGPGETYEPSAWMIYAEGVLAGITLAAAFFGGELVFRHGIGKNEQVSHRE